jgi:hypothetical protein
MPCLTELHTLFYPNKGVKVIPQNIYDLLTPVALAHLIMGDGSALKNGLYLCTDSYNIIDVVRLINVLIIKYRLECNLKCQRPNQYRIYIRSHSKSLLGSIVRPYIHSSMAYKLKFGQKAHYTTEGCFFVNIFKSTTKIKFTVSLRFYITQHSKDELLLRSFISMLGCGKYFTQSIKYGVYTIQTFSDINGKLIPFLNKYPIYGVKALDFLDFCKLAELIHNKTHLTLKGLANIKEIKNGMNKNRVLPLNSDTNNIQVVSSSTNLIKNRLRGELILSNP